VPAAPQGVVAPEETVHSTQDRLGRRGFLGLAVLTVVGFASGELVRNVWENVPNATNVAQRIAGLLGAPMGKELVDKTYNHTTELYLSPTEDYKLSALGDSMNLPNGKLASRPGGTQPGSWPADVKDDWNEAHAAIAMRSGKHVGVIQEVNDAWPGSSTTGLNGREPGFGNNVQLGSPRVEKDITTDPQHQIISIGLNGNNWKDSGNLAVQLYQDNLAFKQFLDKVSEDPSSLIVRGEAFMMLLTNKDLRRNVSQLLDVIERDDETFRQGIERAMAIVSDLDDTRQKAGLSHIDLIVTLPIQLGLRDVVPQVVPRGNGARSRASSAPPSINISHVPTARSALNSVVAFMYTATSTAMARAAVKNPHLFRTNAITVPMIGLEKDAHLFYEDGHLNELGQKALAQWIEARIRLSGAGGGMSIREIIEAEKADAESKKTRR
jgi:hypothetical protein